MTSKKKKDNGIGFFQIGNDKKVSGTLLIIDYIYVVPSLIEDAEVTERIRNQIKYFSKNKDKIKNRITRQVNLFRPFVNEKRLNLLKNYRLNFMSYNLKKGKEYSKKAIQSMLVFENINISEDEYIESVLNLGVFKRTDFYEVETIRNLRRAWQHLMGTLEEKLDLDYIMLINHILVEHEALYTLRLRHCDTGVSGVTERIPPPNKNKVLGFLDYILVDRKMTEENRALEIFCQIITQQWFYNGNKRTAVITANKILISNGCGVLIINDENIVEFDVLLTNYYNKKTTDEKKILKEFLISKCIKRFQ